jgi:hypothetical protein
MLVRFRQDADFASLLKAQCAQRAPLFSAEHELKALLTIIESAIAARHLA